MSTNRKTIIKEKNQIVSAFQRVFDTNNSDVQTVLKHLQEYCCFLKTTKGDELLEGRRQAFLEIINVSKIKPQALISIAIDTEKENARQLNANSDNESWQEIENKF